MRTTPAAGIGAAIAAAVEVAILPLVLAAIAALALGAGPARAQDGASGDAFSTAVAVADRTPGERADAYAAALRRVLLDNAADRTIMNRDDVRAALRGAEGYVESFRFDVPEPGSGIAPGTPVTDAVRRTGEAVALLAVRFDRESVLGLLDAVGAGAATGAADETAGGSAAAAPGAGRAFEGVGSVLVWLSIDDGERRIAGSDPAALKVRERVREIAGGAGVTVAFGDAAELDPGALDALDVDAIAAASLRYATDAVLAGRLSRGGSGAPDPAAPRDAPPGPAVPGAPASEAPAPRVDAPGADGIDLRDRLARFRPEARDGWSGDWAKLATPARRDADAPGTDADAVAPRAVELTTTRSERLDDALRAGVGWLLPDALDAAGARYAYGGRGDPTEGLVWVGSIDSLGEYARALALFEAVPAVESVYPRTVADGAGVFAVRPRGALQGIARAAAATDWLRPGSPPLALVDASPGGSERRAPRAVERGGLAELAREVDLAFDVLP